MTLRNSAENSTAKIGKIVQLTRTLLIEFPKSVYRGTIRKDAHRWTVELRDRAPREVERLKQYLRSSKSNFLKIFQRQEVKAPVRKRRKTNEKNSATRHSHSKGQ